MLPKPAKLLIAFVAAIILSTSLSGCGFKLRGSHNIPDELKVMYLDSVDRYSELARLLKSQLSMNDINLIEQSGANIASLKLFKDRLDRRTLSLFPNGQVAEYELIYSVSYAITLPKQEPQQFEFEIYRDYQDDPENALAKAKELKLILKEMRQQAANKIIRQLASLNKTNT
jgi:LPS-assembly lipoprotein